jgi:plastocyanin
MHRIVVAAIAAALSITGLFASPALATPQLSAHEWQVQAGGPPRFDTGGVRGAGNQFYPGRIAIHQGDSITFKPFGPHTVTYNRPPGPIFTTFAPSGVTTLADPDQTVNSGFIFGQPPSGPPVTFTVTFASTLPPGQYKFICNLHIGMTELVDVRAMGATLPKGDADYLALAQAEITRDLAALDRINAEATEDSQDEDGSPTVLVGAGNKRVSNLRFYPASVTIRVGQTVTFLKTMDPTEPHTVQFGEPPPPPVTDPPTPPDPLVEFRAAGGSTYAGTGFATSGIMTTRQQFQYFQLAGVPGLPFARTKYRLTFTAPGDWKYICALHDEPGMVGIVHVVR